MVCDVTFHEALDEQERAVVWLLTGRTNTDADYQAYVDSIRRLDEIYAGQDGAAILIVDEGNPPPSPAWRKRIADASMTIKSKPVYALVSSSTVVRGVLTIVNWIRPPTYPSAAFATADEAFRWAEEKIGRKLPFARLLSEVRRKASTSARS